MNLLTILLDEAATGTPQSDGGMSIIMIVALIAIFYFFMIRPQQKKQKKIREERAALTKGDKVITAGGIYGTIREVRDDCFIVEIDQNVKVRVDKGMIYKDPASAQEASEQNGSDKK